MIVVDESFRGSLSSQDAVGRNTEISCLRVTFSIQDNNGFTPWLLHKLQAMYKGRFLLQAPTQGGTLNEKKRFASARGSAIRATLCSQT